jgi:FSR family fosmidomycin resistance protein-like MFS transporter
MQSGLVAAFILMMAGCFLAEWFRKKSARNATGQVDVLNQNRKKEQKPVMLAGACFLVVILRSYIGMAVAFPWKQVPILGLCSVLAVVGGKAAGGILAARFGYRKTAVASLILASICYVGLHMVPVGLAALFLFNMTMPVTLHLLICTYPEAPGFSFGLLTFGLFLGFLPSYLEVELLVAGAVLGCVGSLISLALLLAGMMFGGQKEHVSD